MKINKYMDLKIKWRRNYFFKFKNEYKSLHEVTFLLGVGLL